MDSGRFKMSSPFLRSITLSVRRLPTSESGSAEPKIGSCLTQ